MHSNNFIIGKKQNPKKPADIRQVKKNAFGHRTLLIVLLTGLILSLNAFGQHSQRTEGSADQSLRSSGRVNPSSLGMEMDIPLGSYPGRGINVPISLSYSSKVWRMKPLGSIDGGIVTGGCRSLSEAKYGENSASGWTTSLAVPYIEYTGKDNFYYTNGFPLDEGLCVNAPPEINNNAAYIRRISIHLPSGETHELRADDTPVVWDRSSTCPSANGYNCDPNSYFLQANWNRTFYAVDGSNIKYLEDSNTNTYRLLMPDGSYYDFNASISYVNEATARKAVKFTDRNGNFTSYNPSTGVWTDTLGRSLPAPIGPDAPTAPTSANAPLEYSMAGMTGKYKFHWKRLKGDLPAESGLTNFYQDLKYRGDKIAMGNNGNWTVRPEGSYLFSSTFDSYVKSGSDLFNPIVLTKIELPTGQSYTFSYDIYGRIEDIKYPTGGEEKFVYSFVNPLSYSFSDDVSKQANFGVINRKVYPTAGQGTPYQWNYSADYVAPAGYKVSITSPDGTINQRLLHRGNDYTPGGTTGSFGYDKGLAGMPYEELNYSNTGQIVSRKLTHWTKKSFAVAGGNREADWHPRVDYDESIVYDTATGDGVSATMRYEFEGDLNQRETPVLVNKTLQYAFVAKTTTGNSPISPVDPDDPPDPNPTPVPTPVPPMLVRTTETTYQTAAVYLNQNMVGLVTSSTVKDGVETIVARSEIIYDESGYSPNVGRGNPTTARVWDSTKGTSTNPNAYIQTRIRFDYWGNQYEAIDAMGNVTTTHFDTTHHTFPTKVISPIPDPSNVNGSNAAFETTTTFNYTTGLPLTTTDADGQTTTMEYDPITLRPTKVIPPAGAGTSEVIYNDQSGNCWIKTKTQIDTNKWTENTTYFDGLGRTVKSEQVDSQGNIFIEKEFDQNGRIKRVTNPYRSGETKYWTTNVYDEASRIKEVVSPDGAKVIINYGVSLTNVIGVIKQITDQAGKERKGFTDSLGRITRVIEDPTGQNLSTDYVFDTLGNLRKTIQGEQSRYFLHDSLSRLLYAKQPEQEANTAFIATDAVTGNANWSVKYQYDDNSNITSTTDARGVSVTGTYDKLDRLKFRDYSDATPDVSFYYDGRGLGGIPNYSKGKTTKVSSSVSETRYTSFDNLGRLLSSEQRTPFSDTETIATAMPRTSSYQYNLSGALVQQTYPSGRVVKNEFDADGGLMRVAGNAAGQTEKTYANSFSYTAAGAVESMKLGNGKWESAKYNNRLQVEEIGLGNSATDTSLLKLSFGYGTSLENNGSMKSQTMAVPSVGNNAGFTAVQTYDYDSLNRLQSATETISTNQTWKQTFQYDRYGNRRYNTDNNNTTTLGSCLQTVCNPLINTSDNRLSAGQGYGYDKDGNLTVDAENQRFVYDAENKQTQFFKGTNNTSTPDATYLYDGEGKRVKKISYLETTVFVYDGGGQLVAEYSTQLSPTPQTSYLTQDHLGSPRVITNQLGAATSRKDYAAFGVETLTAQRTSGLGYQPGNIRQDYTSYEKDIESGLDFAQARQYNSAHGRFTSVDPLNESGAIDDPQSLNRYSYALNSPHVFTDPSGLLAQSSGSSAGCSAEFSYERCGGDGQFWGGAGSNFGDDYAMYYDLQHMSSELAQRILSYEYQVNNAFYGATDDSAGGQTFDIFWKLFDNGSITTDFSLPVKVAVSLAWHQKGILGKVGDFSRNFANTITMGFVETVERDLHGMDQTERDRLENSAAGQAGNNVGMVAGILLPGPGGKIKATGWVARKIFGSLETALQNKVKSAIAKGIVAPKGNSGIIRLTATEAAATGYTHKIKILGGMGDARIYGRQGSNGHIIFDMITGHKK